MLLCKMSKSVYLLHHAEVAVAAGGPGPAGRAGAAGRGGAGTAAPHLTLRPHHLPGQLGQPLLQPGRQLGQLPGPVPPLPGVPVLSDPHNQPTTNSL